MKIIKSEVIDQTLWSRINSKTMLDMWIVQMRATGEAA